MGYEMTFGIVLICFASLSYHYYTFLITHRDFSRCFSPRYTFSHILYPLHLSPCVFR